MSLYEAPINRNVIDSALPWMRGLFGVAFIAYSSGSTIVFMGADLLWLLVAAKRISIPGTFADAYWIASAAALIWFLGEVFTAERFPGAYRAFLWPDAFYTARGVQATLAGALAVFLIPYMPLAGAAWIAWIVAWPIAIYIGYKIAKWGEILLLGQRRTFGAIEDAPPRLPRRRMRSK